MRVTPIPDAHLIFIGTNAPASLFRPTTNQSSELTYHDSCNILIALPISTPKYYKILSQLINQKNGSLHGKMNLAHMLCQPWPNFQWDRVCDLWIQRAILTHLLHWHSRMGDKRKAASLSPLAEDSCRGVNVSWGPLHVRVVRENMEEGGVHWSRRARLGGRHGFQRFLAALLLAPLVSPDCETGSRCT